MLSEKYKCGLYGDGNFLESSLDNGHFITGMLLPLQSNPWLSTLSNWDAFCGPYSFLINLYIFIRIGLYSIPLDFCESVFVEYNH